MKNFESPSNIAIFIEELIKTPEWKTLKDKTQVFNDRVSKKVKSRGVHCDDVGDIAHTLCSLMGKYDITCDKARLIGLIHDLGHIPYGHAGESVADSIIKEYEFKPEELKEINEVRKLLFGEEYALANPNPCFEHNENSVLRFVTLCREFGFEIDKEIVIGILSHSTSRYKQLPMKLSQQAVRLADKLAYINYDVDDLFASFADKKEEMDALEVLYKKPLLNPNGNEIKIKLSSKEYTLYEFLTKLGSAERIDSFIQASVQDAKVQISKNISKYENYETVLTGCNDIAVELAGLRKVKSKAKTQEEKEIYEDKIKKLNQELYERSPILYAAYEIKNRSDEFIRSGKGLSKETQVTRTNQALSAVGNKDLLNEYIYKTLVKYLQQEIINNQSLTKEDIEKKYEKANIPKEYVDLYFEYIEFKNKQNETILSLAGNSGMVYPEIYTIVNFIGIHSNTQLNELAKIGNLTRNFSDIVLLEIQNLMSDPELYDSQLGVFTKKGMKKRENIVKEHGALIELDFGLEEENIVPTTSDETIEKLVESGYTVKDYSALENTEKKVATVSEFQKETEKVEKEYIDKEKEKLIISKNKNDGGKSL